ncbi:MULTISPECIES: ubiquinol-cytochrome c reductase iron-sulfur subunit [unclassified Pusillimonas]|uniref:ubiquinol-cytochrome c reductase iron-sulfur subunit n=1 Tax=unclassified Pusillimonas TaxID=2640016 RepID=UPI000B9CE18C|nr:MULTISPECIES: ubiquinol-cytochrome c reductase iron-sulfur subunit [unclassified Pusillimonas]OXR48938.1 ubiquinol-cytochrome c reductase iron-sulfur subunit [Pusillimonas sp. T2]ROT45796.1 ubiquinol-cytochrome c reductase iron-sulfur subunit [Pusillimonas sp. NJUB218]
MSQDKSQHDAGAVDLSNLPPDPSRRLWVTTACAVGGVAGVATAVPFVGSFAPSEKAKAAGAPVELDVASIPPGQMRTVEWRGKPVWVLHRTPEQLEALKGLDGELADPNSDRPGYTPPYAKNEYRSRKPEYLVAVGICTHLGCSPTPELAAGPGPGLPADWEGGFFCPCHGSAFDLAGRVYKNKPAPDNLEVPPYEFSADGSRVIIGVDEDNKA